jgi:hypothetical protein
MIRRSIGWVVAGAVIGVTAMMALPSGAATRVPATDTPDHTALHYYMKPGTSRTFNMPDPGLARVEIAASFPGPPAQLPASNVMSALVSYAPETHHLTWVGTNSDGAQSGSNEGSSRTIAKICGTTCGFAIARLGITTGPGQMTLTLNENAGTDAYFTVNLWY